MKLVVDGRMICLSGIGRYLREVLGRLTAKGPALELMIVGNPSEIHTVAQECFSGPSTYRVHDFTAPIYSLREQLLGSVVFQAIRADLLFFPHYNVPFFLRRPFVVTVHDTTHLRFPNTFGRLRSNLAHLVMARALREARRILTPSETTRDDIERIFPFCRGKVAAVPEGVSATFSPAPSEEVAHLRRTKGLPAVYVLTVGNRKPHKNLDTAAEVVRRVRARHPELGWVVVGKRFQPFDAVDSVRPLLGGQLVELEDVPDRDLRLLYAGALALLMPSRWEGFGLPALEAMACGTPVVASSIPSIREVVGTAGLLHPPGDDSGFTDAVMGILNDANRRRELSLKALRRAQQFTWDRTAAQTWEILQEALCSSD